jgi:hypothetical protein
MTVKVRMVVMILWIKTMLERTRLKRCNSCETEERHGQLESHMPLRLWKLLEGRLLELCHYAIWE